MNASSGKVSAKFVIAGDSGVGKTTFVGAVSEIAPVRTESHRTTVAMDFGRITIDDELVLYLFGTPGQDRFDFMWDDLVAGALGAVVLVAAGQPAEGAAAVDYFKGRQLPYVVAVNQLDDRSPAEHQDIRRWFQLDDDVLVIDCDARSRPSVKNVLVSLFAVIVGRTTAMAATAAS